MNFVNNGYMSYNGYNIFLSLMFHIKYGSKSYVKIKYRIGKIVS